MGIIATITARSRDRRDVIAATLADFQRPVTRQSLSEGESTSPRTGLGRMSGMG
jgi:hypothetical protein